MPWSLWIFVGITQKSKMAMISLSYGWIWARDTPSGEIFGEISWRNILKGHLSPFSLRNFLLKMLKGVQMKIWNNVPVLNTPWINRILNPNVKNFQNLMNPKQLIRYVWFAKFHFEIDTEILWTISVGRFARHFTWSFWKVILICHFNQLWAFCLMISVGYLSLSVNFSQ